MIVPMKRVCLYALKSDRGGILKALQREQLIMITEGEEAVRDLALPEAENELAEVGGALDFVSRFAEKRPMFAQREQVSFERLVADDPQARELMERAEGLREKIAGQESLEASKTAYADSLSAWNEMDIPFDQLAETRYTKAHPGFVPPQTARQLSEFEDAHVELYGTSPLGVAALVVVLKADDQEVLERAKELGFSEISLPESEMTAAKLIEQAMVEAAEAAANRLELEREAREISAEVDRLRLLHDTLASDRDRLAAPYCPTESTFMLTGWTPADRVEKLKECVAQVTDCFEVTAEDPADDEIPPTLTRNNRFITAFETVTDMFSRPDPRGVDPNPVMGPWYWIIFGMMMADVGYGLLMAVALLAFKKLSRPRGDLAKLVNVLLFSSVTTVFWGVMFGSYFGAEWFPPVIFTPLDNPLETMIICCVLGALHIFTGMIVKMVTDIKSGHLADAIFDQLSWIVLISGLGLLFVPALSFIGKIMALVGAAVILFTAGRAKKGVFGKVSGGLLGLYGISSYAGDIISYARILALMLSSGVVAYVMNLLASMVQGSVFGFILSIPIYFVGHAFNLVMGLLSAYVHAGRLQYIEFFSKFYDGGGYAYRPLAPTASYVELAEGDEAKSA